VRSAFCVVGVVIGADGGDGVDAGALCVVKHFRVDGVVRGADSDDGGAWCRMVRGWCVDDDAWAGGAWMMMMTMMIMMVMVMVVVRGVGWCVGGAWCRKAVRG
jgi:hypothetical protein